MNFLGLLAGLGLSLSFLVTAQTGGPEPPPVLPAVVTREQIDLPGTPEPHTPPTWNRVAAFRYALPGNPVPAVVLVLIPGLNSGPNTLDLLARELLSTAGLPLEVWAVRERPAVLQDRRGIEAALAYDNPDFALGYYYGNLVIDGQTFNRRVEDVPSAAYWGLDVHLRDIYAVVQEAHRRFPQAKVVLGGHSLGGILAALYAGYDFGRTPSPDPVPFVGGVPAPSPDAGARDLSGLLLLDGLPLKVLPHVSAPAYLGGFRIFTVGRIPGVDDLLGRNGRQRVGPFADLPNFARTRDSILLNVIAVYAYLRPEAPSYLPFYRGGLPITNEALLGAALSSDLQPDLLIRASVGVPTGVFRRIPDPAHANPQGLLDLRGGRPAPGDRLIRWISYEERTPRPRVDLHQLEAAILQPGADFTQWYTPWRLFLDIGLAYQLDTSDPFARQFVSLTQVHRIALPILLIGAGQGLVRDARAALFFLGHIATPPSQVSVTIFKEYTHLDLEDAVANPAVPRIRAWLESVVH